MPEISPDTARPDTARQDTARQETAVLIVGGGPVGLATAIELGRRKVRCILVERSDRIGHAPRAKTTNVRTRTHLRRWGIADRLAEAAPFGVDYPSNIQFVTGLSGPSIACIANGLNCAPERNPLYPEHAQWIPQYKLERVLRAYADSLDCVDIRLNSEFLSAEQADGQVRARILDGASGTERVITSAYLVGADGARSRVRELIGAGMAGRYGLSHNYNIVFRAPGLEQAQRHAPAIMYWQLNPHAPSLIGPMDADDIWFFMPLKMARDTVLSDEAAIALIRSTTGIDLPYEILSRDEWAASQLIADRYRRDRIFLAGDACHLHPPFGGFGMNMGIADAVDLGWKLAATLQGWGGAPLLDSYEIERRPIHQMVMDEAVANHSVLPSDLWREGIEDDTPHGAEIRQAVARTIQATKAREFHTLGTVLGCSYGPSPVIVDDGSAPPVRDIGTYLPSSRPGCLAPHAWLADGSSLYDRFGEGFTLATWEAPDSADSARARQDAGAQGIPLAVIPLALLPLAEPEARALYPSRHTLIRPDQYVGWRGESWSAEALGIVSGRRDWSRAA